MKDNYTADYEGFSLVSGGLFYSITSVFRGKSGSEKGLIKTAIAIVFLTWVPLCLLAIFSGTLNDTDLTISFFEDFLLHVRYLFVVPFLILIERIVDRSFIGYVKNSDQLIPNSQQGDFNRMVKRLDNLTDSYIPEIVILVILYSTIIINWNSLHIFDSGRNYLFVKGTHSLNMAGWYYLLVCGPILQLVIFRWFWRWFVWVYSVIRISKFKLQIDPLHADQMAGLEYLNIVPMTFSFILVAPSAILSAYIGMDIIYHGALFKEFAFHIAVYIFFLPLILYAPLLIFMPYLIQAKTWGIHNFGNLIRKHNKDYAAKWIDGVPPKEDQLLGTMDNSSLSDINGSYAPVQGMKLIPVNLKMIIFSFALNVLPYIPLIFTYYSPTELFNQFLKSLI